MEKELNTHHKIPRSKQGLTNNINCQLVNVLQHNRWHQWCGNDTPVEALCRVLIWNEGIRNENFYAELMALFERYINNYYAKKTHSGFIKSETQRVNELIK